jgi:hypothetical protein
MLQSNCFSFTTASETVIYIPFNEVKIRRSALSASSIDLLVSTTGLVLSGKVISFEKKCFFRTGIEPARPKEAHDIVASLYVVEK